MTSTFENLGEDRCQRCGWRRQLVEIQSNGEEYEVCRECATRIQVGRVA